MIGGDHITAGNLPLVSVVRWSRNRGTVDAGRGTANLRL